ncbi:SPFH domain-containing protein [Clostridium hydrogenum]|uniref:SPFH domain-containing protein n=1 Tax=Clostridium hydrogenum TaxID=2855764 RepID=UPI001EFF148A|nr:SPFH domain-containing protein [Clostridium hydrogenum]
MNQSYIYLIIAVIAIIAVLFLVLKFIGIVVIKSSEVGIVEKWWSPKGSLNKQIIALNGEAGFEPDVLRAGIHLKTPLMYKIHRAPLITIPQGKIGYVFAKDGKALDVSQTLGRVIPEADNFQDVKGFLKSEGQKGPQRAILREGTYAFNLAQFIIITENGVYSLTTTKEENQQVQNMADKIRRLDGFNPVIINGKDDSIGIVTVNDGPALPNEVLIAPIIGDKAGLENYHNNFQDPEKFLKAGGFKGRQMQILADGTYFINRLFATVEYLPKTIINIGEVGVVVSYYGDKGKDVTGDTYKHGELVSEGSKGIWEAALAPGKYGFNIYAGKVVKVPTTNVILKWISGQSGNHRLDENLKEISLITKDAFEPSLPLTVVMHIDYKKASRVIQRFGDVKLLIEQSLDPMIAGYFKNVGQTMTLVELIQNRNEIQNRASAEMKEKFEKYDLELEEVLIGTPIASKNDNRIDTILAQLRDRQLAMEQIATFDAEQKAAEKEIELNKAKAASSKQADLTASAVEIQIKENEGKAQLLVAKQIAEKTKTEAEANLYKQQKDAEAKAYTTKQDAEAKAYAIEKEATANSKQISLLGSAEASKIKSIGEAEADKEAKIGISKAIAAREQVNAYGGPQYQVIQDVMTKLAEALKESKIDIVPRTYIGGNSDGKTPNALEGILNLLLADMGNGTSTERELSPEVEKIKSKIIESLK